MNLRILIFSFFTFTSFFYAQITPKPSVSETTLDTIRSNQNFDKKTLLASFEKYKKYKNFKMQAKTSYQLSNMYKNEPKLDSALHYISITEHLTITHVLKKNI